MGYLPYYLLYGQHPLHPFDVLDATYHIRDWLKATSMKELLALRMQQLAQRSDLIRDAEERNFCLQNKAVDAYNERHANCMNHGESKNVELRLVSAEEV